MVLARNMRRGAGFTLTEIVVVLGIVALLASLVLPAMAQVRSKAQVMQCTSNLRQIHQALSMYDIDFDRQEENYPNRLTYLHQLGYLRNEKVFVCPADTTRAKNAKIDGVYVETLKPGNAVWKYEWWAERAVHTAKFDPEKKILWSELNCSYIYEFNMRECDRWSTDPDGYAVWDTQNFGYQMLVGWYDWNGIFDLMDFYYDDDEVQAGWDGNGDPVYIVIPECPSTVDHDGDHVITWQEVKFSQLAKGDVYTTGYSGPGERNIPVTWSWDPYNTIHPGGFDRDDLRMHGYPRTWMPIVNCYWHVSPLDVDNPRIEQVLSLALDGNTFYATPSGWEQTAWKYGRQMSAIVGEE